MKLPVGEKIKTMRTAKGLTQEGLAQAIGVSCQSVSRWEMGACYPDIELLPSLANFFGTTLDDLLGMNEMRSAQTISDIYTAVFDEERQGNWQEAARILREALKIYPDDDGFTAELATALGQTGETNDLTEAIVLAEAVLSRSMSDKLRSTVRASLCFLYKKSGAQEKAEAMSKTLPHIWECREMLQVGIAAEPDREKMLSRSFNIASQVLSDVAQGNPIPFSLGYKPEEDVNDSALIDFVSSI